MPDTITLPKLHRVIQTAMGWQGYHLHQFIVRDERRVRLNQLESAPKEKLVYEYDFGDGREHVVLLEALREPEPGAVYPRCITGKRACPPEDCGGVWGCASFLETIQDPQHPEHETMLEWVGGAFDPEAFDVEQVNAELRTVT